MIPKVSICVPNLNHCEYLQTRFESIFNQRFQEWELIVYDSYSDDGAWEYIQGLAAHEPRMRISQGPREGIYPGWNACIRQAKGEYVYIATSDDTMTPDCLEKMVAALDRHPECGLAHCCGLFIDEQGHPHEWKWDDWPAVKYFGETIKREHIRPPGHDVIVALATNTPYFSISFLLIRRRLFERAGLFNPQWGAIGDLEWQMRAALLTSTIHIPQCLATWRLHKRQASSSKYNQAARKNGLLVEMADEIITFSRKLDAPKPGGLPCRLRRFFVIEQMDEIYRCLGTRWEKFWFLCQCCVYQTKEARWFLRNYLGRKMYRSWTQRHESRRREVRREIGRLGILDPKVIPMSD